MKSHNLAGNLMSEIQGCTHCSQYLPLGPRPVVSFNEQSKILIIGHAPGTKVHASGKPWDDASGRRLRTWLGVDDATFYNPANFGIMPMGFCYPGKGKSGDLPPRPECAPLWHDRIHEALEQVSLTLLIGKFAQAYYLGKENQRTLTATVQRYQHYLPTYLPLPHPSPRNNIWLRKNPWFTSEVLPILQAKVQTVLT